MNKKTKFIQITNISLLFGSFVNVYIDKASEQKRNICNLNKFLVFFLVFFIHIYFNAHI